MVYMEYFCKMGLALIGCSLFTGKFIYVFNSLEGGSRR